MGKLTVAKVRSAGPGRHVDGDGLHLLVKPSGARSWVLRLQVDHKRFEMGLGAVDTSGRRVAEEASEVPILQRRLLTLEEAREKAAILRRYAMAGIDPRSERDRERRKVKLPTFAEAVSEAHKQWQKGWSDKLAAAFKSSLEGHVVPVLGAKRVDLISGSDVVDVLAPIWTAKPQQARKVRHRIMQVLEFAQAKGWRDSTPDSRQIGKGLGKQPEPEHFAAMPYAEVPAFFAGELAKEEASSRLALLFAILTAARSGEVRKATWDQFDLEAKLWRRSPGFMKSRRGHDVTLSEAALAVLAKAAERFGRAGLVFPSARPGKPMSDMTLSKMMRAAGQEVTVHGFRSSFRDWAAERMPTVPAMVAELALAHAVGDKTEQAYLRSDLLEQRFALLNAWGRYAAPSLCGLAGNVVQLEARA